MKPIPFAQYLANLQSAEAAAPPERPQWPPRAKGETPRESARQSPLLRRIDDEKAERNSEQAQRVDQGRLQAFADGREAAERDFEAQQARLRATMEANLVAARAEWAAQEGERLAAAHRVALEAFEARCSSAVANILRPFLTTAVIGRVTEALVENLNVLFASRTQSLFEISGPPDLLDALRRKFGENGAAIIYAPDDSIDVRVCCGDTIIETQLGAWMQALHNLPQADA
jgi:hypothetical protein